MLSRVLYFAVGAVIGSAATYFVVKNKYEELANQERIEREEYYKQKEAEEAEEAEEGEEEVSDLEQEEYKRLAGNYSDPEQEKGDDILKYYRKKVKEHEEERFKEEEEEMANTPYVISPDEFGEEGYKEVSLTYYADGVLTDEENYEMSKDQIKRTVGEDAVNHFGEYEEDSVFVRNDKLKTDYEILKDLRAYSEVE